MVNWFAENPDVEKVYTGVVPMHRLGEPQDIANMVIFLASDDARYITGQDYSVDGGMTA